MSNKVNQLIEQVEGEHCEEVVLAIVADDVNPSSDFDFKEIMQSMTRRVNYWNCVEVQNTERFWNAIYRAVDMIDNTDECLVNGIDPTNPNRCILNCADPILVSSKDLEFLEALQHLLMVCAEVLCAPVFFLE